MNMRLFTLLRPETHRGPAHLAHSGLAALLLVTLLPLLAVGQDSGDGAAIVRAAYAKTKTAKTIEQFTAIIDEIQSGIDLGLGEADQQYADNLLAWTYDHRGEVHATNGEEAEALADFETALQLAPERWQAMHNRGVSYALAGRYDDAIADFEEVVRLNPKHTNAYFNLGELHYESGDYASAIEAYNRAIQLDPRDGALRNSRGHAYYLQGDYQPAFADYTEALRLDPQNAAAYTNRGDAYADLGQFDRAANDYRAALRIDPELGRAYQSAAWLMATCPNPQFRDPERAVLAAQKAIELDGENYRYLDTLAAAYANRGNFPEAQETMARALEAAPETFHEDYQARLEAYQQNLAYRDGTLDQQQQPQPGQGRQADGRTAPPQAQPQRLPTRRNTGAPNTGAPTRRP